MPKHIFLTILLAGVLVHWSSQALAKEVTVQELQTLRQKSIAKVVIMSDNKGQANNLPSFARMNHFIKKEKPFAIIGVGDHLKRKWIAPFLDLLAHDDFWHTHFYPNIADGENGYYGRYQGDWCKGGKLLEAVDLQAHATTKIRDNGCEYYSIIRHAGYDIHLLQAHFADEPGDDRVAFTQDSRQWLMDILTAIQKKPRTFVIVAAHSRSGNFLQSLSDIHKKQVLAKADLLLSATTHHFERLSADNSNVLSINTGSPTYPSQQAFAGFVLLSFLENPEQILVEYVGTEDNHMLPPSAIGYIFMMTKDKPIENIQITNLPRDLDFDKVLFQLPESIPEKKLTELLKQEIGQRTGRVIEALDLKLDGELKKGNITRAVLEKNILYNNGVVVYGLEEEINGKKNMKWYATNTFSYPSIALRKKIIQPIVLEQRLVDLMADILRKHLIH